MFGPELPGEDFSELTFQSEPEQERKRGRPSEIAPEALRRAVAELQFVLEQNWGVVGWLLWESKSLSHARNAFGKIVHQRCRYLESFTEDQTRETTSAELRKLRKRVADFQQRYRRNFAELQCAQEACERAFDGWAYESDPDRRVQIQAIRLGLEREYHEAESLEQTSRLERDSLQAELKEREAYFAQSEILRFIQSNRRQFNPLNVARAMAGLPRVTSRVSCELCAKYGINPPHGTIFEVFQTIQRVLREPIRDLGSTVDLMRNHLLSGPGNDLPLAAELRNNWHFLDSAIRSAVRDTDAPHGSLAFRVLGEYNRTSMLQSAADSVLARAHRLIRNGEDTRVG